MKAGTTRLLIQTDDTYVKPVFRIRIRIGSGFRGVLEPDPDSKSGSRSLKMMTVTMTMTMTLAGSGSGLRFLAGSGFNEYGSETLFLSTGTGNPAQILNRIRIQRNYTVRIRRFGSTTLLETTVNVALLL